MELPTDLKTLNKSIIYAESMDTPDTIYAVVPNADPQSILPKDQVRLEAYVRLKALPLDVMKLVVCITEARNISNKIAEVVPFLDRAEPRHHPSGVVEMQWKLDAGAVFGIILHGFSFSLEEDGESFTIERKGKITWRFHGPGVSPRSGEFKSVDELIEFMGQCFVKT